VTVKTTVLSKTDLDNLVKGRNLYVWGASIVGSGACRALERCGFPPVAFIDSSLRFKGKTTLGYQVLTPGDLLDVPTKLENSFIIIASGHYEDEITTFCQESGLVQGRDFISARDLSPVDPSVDVSGLCNLRCISCPRGNYDEQPPRGFMSATIYKQVLEKLLKELPFMGSIQLYAWGEPLLNPEIVKIIQNTVERRVLCAISTNLNMRKDFTEVVRARPDWIKISTSGYGSPYETTHTGANWDLLLINLKKLSKLKQQFHPDMYVEINYHLYRHNLDDEYRKMLELCSDLGFIFRPNYAYLYPLDKVMDYCEGREIGTKARQTLDMMLLNIDEGLERARSQANLPCAEERCFPISWDLHVRSCGAYFWPTISDDYLTEPMSSIIDRRNKSNICTQCKRYALHRYTSVYLQEATPSENIKGTNGIKG
jgi:MoaA/NifB/PqqE/SkfB family radical SAM enzyme